jgi:hypothetical protein
MKKPSEEQDNRRIVRVSRLSEQGTETDLKDKTPEELVGMVWQLTVDAWAFKGEPIDESRLQRHIVRVSRRSG